ncbi:phage tail tape measure protein [Proteus vulgaris]|uniref:Phage tail tape measure protein n=1 Tax=Proteus vulgaris TaxID=585 RepID=A0A379FDJ5_PROVU|nr:phage tail tape measure protein [Proteus vulgaris]SUC17393.1 phage tail tape measure protein [Proteus vulgaris]
MADIATISLKADTSDLERGTQKLKEFGDTAERVSDASRDLNDQFNRGVDHQKLASEAIKQQKKELDDLLNSINPTNKAFDALDKATQKLIEANKKGILPKDQFADYNAILEQTRDKLTRVNMSLTAEGRALLEQERASNQAKVAADKFLSSIKNQVDAIGKTKTELLEMKAAQLGVADKAQPYIDKIKESSKQTDELARSGNKAKGTLKEFLTSINMGGIAKGGLIGVVSASVVSFTKIIYEAEMEFTQFNKQLILTGNYANKSASQLNEMARVMSGFGITRGEMAKSITSVVSTGVFSNNEISRVSKAAAQMNYITGQAIDTTIDQFKRLQDEPLKMSLELEKANHHLTAAQLEQIRTLELQGNQTAAARLAIDAYAQSINDGANDIVENLGFLESAWKGVQDAAKKSWDAMLNIGRTKDLRQQVNEYERMLVEFQINPASKGIFFAETNMTPDELKAKVAELREQLADVDLKKAQDQAEKVANQSEVNKFRIKQEFYNKYASWETRRNEELAKLNANKHALSDDEYKEYEKMINYRFRDRKMPGTGRDKTFKPDLGTRAEEEAKKTILSLQTQLKVLNDHKTVYDVISSERKKLWETEAKISVLEDRRKERALTRDEQSLLLKEKSIVASLHEAAVLGDQIELQKIKNRELDKQTKYIDTLVAKGNALEIGAGLSSRLQQREIALSQADTPDKKKALEEYYAKEDSLRGNWELGFKRGFAEFQDQATDVYGNVAQITQSAFQGMSNTVADFLLTSKFNLADFTKSFLEMTTKMITQMALLNAMRAGFAGTTFGSFLGFAEGGYTGGGGKYDPAGVVHKGEFVFTKEATQRLGVDNLYRLMDAGKRGYASGGHVGGSAPMSVTQPTAFIARNPQIAGGGNVQVNLGGINIESGQQQPSSNQANTSSLKREFQQMVENGVNNLLRNPASALSRTIKGN